MTNDAPARGRGRPAIGDMLSIRLSPEHRALALQLGAGSLSAGIRAALDASGARLGRSQQPPATSGSPRG
jgi:hypothetical protein